MAVTDDEMDNEEDEDDEDDADDVDLGMVDEGFMYA